MDIPNTLEITKEVNTFLHNHYWVVPAAGAGVLTYLAGIVANGTMGMIKRDRGYGKRLDQFEQNFHKEMSREEIDTMYSELLTNIAPSVMGKKHTRAKALQHDLDTQLMQYATKDVHAAIEGGAVLDIKDPIAPHSEIYRSAQSYQKICQQKRDRR